MSSRDTRATVFLTGAGISADSGVATFRGSGGLWEGLRIEDVATPGAWARDPARVWRFYQTRRAALADVEPNAAHRAIARFEAFARGRGDAVTLVTQNVDDLHQRAGSRPIPMHGQLARLRCERCGETLEDLDRVDPDTFVPCGDCGHERLRPDIVWFGEMPHHLDAIERALAGADRFVAIGTSGAVYPAAGYLAAARQAGIETIVLSLEAPDNLDPRDRFIPGRAVETVPTLVDAWMDEAD